MKSLLFDDSNLLVLAMYVDDLILNRKLKKTHIMLQSKASMKILNEEHHLDALLVGFRRVAKSGQHLQSVHDGAHVGSSSCYTRNYLKSTMHSKLRYVGDGELVLRGFTDSNWASNASDKKSNSGCCFNLG